MKKIIIFSFLLFGAFLTLFGQEQQESQTAKPKSFNEQFLEWDNKRFENMYSKRIEVKKNDTLFVKNDTLLPLKIDRSRLIYTYFEFARIDEIRRIGIIKIGKYLLNYLNDENYDFHACFLLYETFGPIVSWNMYFDYKTRTEWVSSGQKEKDYKFWYDQFYGEDDCKITYRKE